MNTITINRSTKRIALGVLLRAALVGTGKPCQKVYDEPMVSFPEQIAVVLESSGAEHGPESIDNDSDSTFDLTIHTFVIWQAGSEDTLDLLECSIASVIQAAQSSSSWDKISYNGKSTVDITPLINNGPNYRHEAIPITITISD